MKRAAVKAALIVLESRIEEWSQFLGTARMPELAKGFRLDLADPLARHIERAAHFLERVLGTVADAEAHLQDLLLTRGERAQDLGGLFLEIRDDDVLGGGDHAAILDEIAEMRVF